MGSPFTGKIVKFGLESRCHVKIDQMLQEIAEKMEIQSEENRSLSC